MARTWTCPKCRTQHPRTRQKCECGRSRPKPRPPAHRAILDLVSYEQAVQMYGERCGICGAGPKTRRLHRDHDHKTGQLRGLLCFPCNSVLRQRMDVTWLLNAAKYLDTDVSPRYSAVDES